MTEQNGSPDQSEAPEERPESQSITADQGVEDAWALLRSSRDGVLCTISKRVAGWPFGSIAPFALDRRGDVVIFISTLAEHTKNIEADPRVSLLVQERDTGGDAQAHGRLTVLGRAERVPVEEERDVRARYLERLPSASVYSEAHDFRFYRITPTDLRFIGGFGRIFWLDAARFRARARADALAPMAQGVIAHMNEDHAEALLLYCKAFKNLEPKEARMVGLDAYGLDVECRSPDVRLRFDFDRPATPETVRPIVVEMVARARQRMKSA